MRGPPGAARRGAPPGQGPGLRRVPRPGVWGAEMDPVPILITNDDGFGAEGLQALERSLEGLGPIWVVAPDREQSGQGHALTLNHPLRLEKRGPRRFAVQGTPTDCIYLGVHRILPERPRLVVSGINRGTNLGDDITYSGTVSAAFEGTLIGVPSFAVSQQVHDGAADFAVAARFTRALAEVILDRGLPPDTLINVNVPHGAPGGVRVTRQGKRLYPGGVIERKDPKGRTYFWIGGAPAEWADDAECDFAALAEGMISLTPLHLDLTNHKVMNEVRHWNLKV
jgi:5'-nucleotidase